MAPRTVVVTGSSDNIGRAVALKFAGTGANVVVNARTNVSGGEKVAKEIRESGGKSIFVRADVSQPDEASVLIDKAVAEFGNVDVLVNNAGGFEPSDFLDSTVDHWRRMLDSNLLSAVFASLAFARQAGERGGKIINMTSIRGLDRGGRPGGIAYSSAKAAVASFTRSLAHELAPRIQVNAVAPGFTRTTAFDGVPSPVIDGFLNSTLLKRWLSPDEIADAFLYLAGADGITGEVLVIDAGWYAA